MRRSFYKIFDQEVIYDLPNNEFNKEIIYWLSQYLVGNLREPLDSISELNACKQIYVYETWFSLIKCPDEIETPSEADNFISNGLRAFYENVKFGCIIYLKTLQNNLHYFGCRLLARQ
jgi:hypothetical protein